MNAPMIIVKEALGLLEATRNLRPFAGRSPRSRQRNGKQVMVIGGYLADYLPQKFVYWGLLNHLRGNGYSAEVSRVNISMGDFHHSAELVGKEIRIRYPEGVVDIVGHSLGGALAVAIKALTKTGHRIGMVLTLGTPFLGTPLAPLGWAVEKTTGASRKLLTRHEKSIRAISHSIISIVSPGDGIAPPQSSVIPGMPIRIIHLGKRYPRSRISHIGLVLDPKVQKLIASLLLDGVCVT